jgi:hypothetical protein
MGAREVVDDLGGDQGPDQARREAERRRGPVARGPERLDLARQRVALAAGRLDALQAR